MDSRKKSSSFVLPRVVQLTLVGIFMLGILGAVGFLLYHIIRDQKNSSLVGQTDAVKAADATNTKTSQATANLSLFPWDESNFSQSTAFIQSCGYTISFQTNGDIAIQPNNSRGLIGNAFRTENFYANLFGKQIKCAKFFGIGKLWGSVLGWDPIEKKLVWNTSTLARPPEVVFVSVPDQPELGFLLLNDGNVEYTKMLILDSNSLDAASFTSPSLREADFIGSLSFDPSLTSVQSTFQLWQPRPEFPERMSHCQTTHNTFSSGQSLQVNHTLTLGPQNVSLLENELIIGIVRISAFHNAAWLYLANGTLMCYDNMGRFLWHSASSSSSNCSLVYEKGKIVLREIHGRAATAVIWPPPPPPRTQTGFNGLVFESPI